jgi:diguanylate cyclase (GGDEF)-like protein/PAS domain S-box-containing protein
MMLKHLAHIGIQKKLALLFLGSGLLFMLAVYGVVDPLLYRVRTNVITANQNELLTALQSELDAKLNSALTQLTAVAGVVPPETMHDPVLAQRFLDDRVGIGALFDDGLTLLNPQGKLIAESPLQPQRTMLDFSAQPAFIQALAAQKPLITTPFYSTRKPHHPIEQFIAPVRDTSGKIIGLITGGVRLDGNNVIGSVTKYKVGEKGYMFIYAQDRTMLMHPDPSRIMQQDVPVGANKLFDKALGGWEGTGVTTNSRGLLVVASFKHLKSVPWILATNYPVAEAFVPSQRAANALLIIIALLVLVGVVVSWLVLRSIMRPIATLTAHLHQLDDLFGAQRQIEVPPNLSPELKLLFDNFNNQVATQDSQRQEIAHKAEVLEQQTIQLEQEISAHRQTEISLRQISAKYLASATLMQNICDNVPALIWAKDLDKRYIFTNKANNETLLFARTADEPLGKKHDYFVQRILAEHPDQVNAYGFSEFCDNSDVTTLTSGCPLYFQETGYILGQLVYLDVYKAPLYDMDGELIGTIGSANVVTREKQLEFQTLHLSRLYRVLSEINQYIVRKPQPPELFQFVCDTLVEDEGFRMACVGLPQEQGGYAVVAATGMPLAQQTCLHECQYSLADGVSVISDITVDNYRQCLPPELQQLYEHSPFTDIGGFPICPENADPAFLVIVPQKADLLAHADYQKLIAELVSDVEFALDVSAQEQSQAHNVQQLELAATVFDNSSEGIVVTGADERILSVNRAFCEITGYVPEEVLGKTPRLIKSDRHGRDFYQTMWRTINETGIWHGEIWNRRKNGQVYPAQLSISRVDDANGSISHYIAVFSDISQVKESEKLVDYLQWHDSLTDLPNRRMFGGQLAQAIEMAKRNNQTLSLLCLDLDHFKDINDSFGFLVGDNLLQQMAKRLRSRIRSSDIVARLGGDEFVVLLTDLNKVDVVTQLAAELLELAVQPFSLESGGQVQLSTSIGIAMFPEHGNTALELLQKVDSAVYLSKQRGRDQFAYYSEEMTAKAVARIELSNHLRQALEKNELQVYYQPQVDIQTGAIVGAEALMRWHSPQLGTVPPDRFIPLAEELGCIIPMGEWILREVCTQGRIWLDAGYQLTLAVNLSVVQFYREDIVHSVASILEQSAFPAKLLELEVTESLLMHKEQQTIARLEELHQLNISLAMDDFGTGYSSLSYLKFFPLNVLKIDKSFVDDLPHGRADRKMVTAIIQMGQGLGLKLLAEGVEHQEQLDYLQEVGCDLYQGYHCSKPLPAQEFIALLAGSRS